MKKSVSEQIIANMRYKNLKCEAAQGFIRVLIAAFEGNPQYFYYSWSRSRGRFSLRRRGYTEAVYYALCDAGVSVVKGNDAPRGGALGEFFRCERRNMRAAAFFRNLLAEVNA